MRRKKGCYFEVEPGFPPPISRSVTHRVRFSEVDAMAVAWHGRFSQFFEMASEELGRRIGLSYENYFEAGLRAPIVQFHIDYHRPVVLGEEITITASMVWTEATRLNTEYRIIKENEDLAATGFTVQMLVEGETGEPCLTTPSILETCLERWRKGKFRDIS